MKPIPAQAQNAENRSNIICGKGIKPFPALNEKK